MADTQVVTPRRKRWLSVSLRAIMIAILVIACGLAWVVNRARNTRQAAEAVAKAGGWVRYDWQVPGRSSKASKPPGPAWLRKIVGQEYFEEITFASVSGKQADDSLMLPVGRLGRLESLDLRGTSITGAGLAHLRGHSALRQLMYSSRTESGASLVHLTGLTGLRSLTIMLAADDAHLVHLEALTGLESLHLWGLEPRITDAGLLHLNHLPNLRMLEIRHALITSQGLARLRSVTQLVALTLDDTKVESLDPLCGCGALRRLAITRSPLTSIDPLRAMADLEELWLYTTPTDDAGLEALSNLAKLQRLSLGSTRVTDRSMERIGRLTQLNTLSLDGTQITDEGLRQLSGLNRLNLISLRNTAITEAGLEHLAGLPSLTRILVQDAHTTTAGVAEFRKKHPGIEVVDRPPKPK